MYGVESNILEHFIRRVLIPGLGVNSTFKRHVGYSQQAYLNYGTDSNCKQNMSDIVRFRVCASHPQRSFSVETETALQASYVGARVGKGVMHSRRI